MLYYHDFLNDEFANTYIFKGKQNGYFVEVGACTGIAHSQCYYFEKELNWDGIAVEPQKRFQDDLKKNRKNPCLKCLTNKKEDMVLFSETLNLSDSALSGIKNTLINHEKIEPHKTGWRDNGYREYFVESTTLLDLLEEYNSPNLIDYLGMDCEGCEYDILEHYFNNNKKYLIKFVCLEVGRNDIIDLMKKNDYIELINPILPLWNDYKVTWEKYFIHKTEIDNIDIKIIMNNNM
jgi:FkbM family methyltransferase